MTIKTVGIAGTGARSACAPLVVADGFSTQAATSQAVNRAARALKDRLLSVLP